MFSELRRAGVLLHLPHRQPEQIYGYRIVWTVASPLASKWQTCSKFDVTAKESDKDSLNIDLAKSFQSLKRASLKLKSRVRSF
jgi:hypothetical protein